MGSVELSEIEKRVLPDCDFLWKQDVVNQSPKILSKCGTKDNVDSFISECEKNIKNLPKECRVTWNPHVHSFGGDEFGYLIFFYSEILGVPIRASFSIDSFEQTVVVGNMDIANPKEVKKLKKNLNNPVALSNQEVVE